MTYWFMDVDARTHTIHLREMSPQLTLSDESLWISSSVNSDTLEREERLVGLVKEWEVDFIGSSTGSGLNNQQRRAKRAAKRKAYDQTKD